MKLKINETDLKRIEGKLNKLKDFGKQGTKVYQYRLDLLNAYKKSIVSLMGTVSPNGGMVSVNFMDKSQETYWEALSDVTIAVKKAEGSTLQIWEATGETKDAVRVDLPSGFVGINKNGNEEAFRKALNVEFGGYSILTSDKLYSKRALFTLANNIFKENKDLIVKAISKLIREDIRWGS